MCFAPQWRALFRHLNLQKWREHVVLCKFSYIFTSKCASRHNCVRFFDISASKSGPRLRCFVHFDLEMCFAPQLRALFRHLNFQKWSKAEVLCTFWLGNVLRAATVCTFSTSRLPKVVRQWRVLYILTSKCASRHNGVQFFISHLASWLRTRRFSEPTFRPSGATSHWKNTVFRDFPTFSRICIFFLLTLALLLFSLLIFLFSLPLPCSAFHLSILSEVWLLKLPSRQREVVYMILQRCFWTIRFSGILTCWIQKHIVYAHCTCQRQVCKQFGSGAESSSRFCCKEFRCSTVFSSTSRCSSSPLEMV